MIKLWRQLYDFWNGEFLTKSYGFSSKINSVKKAIAKKTSTSSVISKSPKLFSFTSKIPFHETKTNCFQNLYEVTLLLGMFWNHQSLLSEHFSVCCWVSTQRDNKNAFDVWFFIRDKVSKCYRYESPIDFESVFDKWKTYNPICFELSTMKLKTKHLKIILIPFENPKILQDNRNSMQCMVFLVFFFFAWKEKCLMNQQGIIDFFFKISRMQHKDYL